MKLLTRFAGAAYGTFAGFQVTPLRRLTFFLVGDVALLLAALGAAFVLRFDGQVPWQHGGAFVFLGAVLTAAVVGCQLIYGVYRASWSFIGLRDIALTGLAVGFGTAVLGALMLLWYGESPLTTFPRSVVLIQAPLAFLGLAGFRLARRADRYLRKQRRPAGGRRTLLVGAGHAGEQVLKSIQETAAQRHEVVGFLDDDPLAVGTLIHGVPVLGSVGDLQRLVRMHGADVVILCVARVASSFVRQVVADARAAGVGDVRIIPPLSELVDGQVTLAATRAVGLEDLLGREAVEIRHDEVRGLLHGKRVLVTGGAGTIGAELCRQIARCGPARLVVLDVDETRLHDTALDLRETFPVTVEDVLVDVRDVDGLAELFGRERPQVVFHAAAYKHVPMMERWPLAALHVNVLGTANVASAAAAHGCERFVLISTDKAVEPSSVMGASKRLAEVAVLGQDVGPMKRNAVRFGNVIGSRGSVIPTFERQLRHGGPLTVTHPDVERYFMMTSEAVSLVLQAAALGQSRDIFVLEMGKPVRILEMAREFIRLHGLEPDRDISIAFTGLRKGEKLTEVLHYPDEVVLPTSHPQVRRVMFASDESSDKLLRIVGDLVEHGSHEDALEFLAARFPLVGEATVPLPAVQSS